MKPISAGDTCKVVNGLGQSKSPNLGLTVTVQSFQGEHSGRGRIFRCTGAGIMQLSDAGTYIHTGEADFPTSWLQRIAPTTTDKQSTKELQA
jgi:hypothetical protein